MPGLPTQVSGFMIGNPRWDCPTVGSSSSEDHDSNTKPLPISPHRTQDAKFAFIHHTGPTIEDRDARRLIKKHVMVDIGKSRRNKLIKKKQNQPKTPKSHDSQQVDLNPSLEDVEVSMPMQRSSCIPHFGATRDPFITYPIKMNRRTLELVDHLCNERFSEMKPVRESFFPIGIEDPAAFHQLLAVLAKHLPHHLSREFRKSTEYENREIILHHSEAVKLIKHRMTDPQAATSDGTIAAVVLMICHSYMNEDFKMWHQHMLGLKNILRMREDMYAGFHDAPYDGSGPCSLNPSLRTVLGWIDTTGSLGQDTPPVFPFHEDLFSLHPELPSWITPPAAVCTLEGYLNTVFPHLALITKLFTEVAKFSIFTESRSKNENNFWTKDAAFATRYFEPLTYQLLSLREPIIETDLSIILQEMMRLSLTLYLIPIRRKFGVHGITMKIQVGKLLALLSEPTHLGVELNDLKLWMVSIGAMEAHDTDMRSQFNRILVNLLVDLDIISMKVWEERLKRLLFISEVHEPRFRTIRKAINFYS